MRKLFNLTIVCITLMLLVRPVSAMEFTAPDAPDDIQKYIPDDSMSFGEGLWFLVKSAIAKIRPELLSATETCLSLVAVSMLVSIASQYTKTNAQTVKLVTAVCIGLLMFRSTNTFIQTGIETVSKMSDYCKLLLPTLTAATAANGAVSTSAALYTGCYIFVTILSTVIKKFIVPLTYIYMSLSIAGGATNGEIFNGLKKFVKWLSTWSLKTILYIFTAYMSITGVISGSVDAAALKATKMTISGAVPVVGGALADASDTILVSAAVMKNSVGIYGLFVIIAICLGPFLKIGIQYLLLKLTTAVCSVFIKKDTFHMLQEMTGAMGLVLAMTGTVCLLLLISIVCFIRCSV